MNRPVGASSTEVTMSANARLGNASLRSGLTSVMFMPGRLGNDAGGSPAPTGAAGALPTAGPRPGTPGGRNGEESAGGTSTAGIVSAGGLNALFGPNGF